MPKLTIIRQAQQIQYFTESLDTNTGLNMVLIPAGQFLMGASETEERSRDNERPQHPVNIPSLFMGQCPITQAQWRFVAALPQVNRELDPNSSRFKGDNRPVEQINWFDAVEFCDRLTQHTGKPYRLPSEAEWEYACRAGTTTSFHFGETISTDLANYRGTDDEFQGKTYPGFYGRGERGSYRKETTPVGSFGIANAFGLYDMHGNVLEWCADHWHDNYQGAPTDGSAWVEGGDAARRVLRGGSWYLSPENCRSAFRYGYGADDKYVFIGFRVVCSLARTL